jgi:hypothetical protein
MLSTKLNQEDIKNLNGSIMSNKIEAVIKNLHTHVYSSTVHNSQVMETDKMPYY